MFKRLLSFLAVMVIVTGCSYFKKDDTASVTTDGGLTSQEVAPVTGIDTASMPPTGGPVPGTQQDLVVNVGDRVFFDYDKYDLKGEARTTVEHQAQWLKTYPNLKITVEGHCDERGTREYNLALGEKRAMSVRNYMIAMGVDASRIQTVSYGKERPAVLGADDASWAQNRRGVTVVE